MFKKSTIVLFAFLVFTAGASTEDCIECHEGITPGIVSDWEASRHGEMGMKCNVCHGDAHTSANDVANVNLPTPDTCAKCHSEQHGEYMAGKHSKAWPAMKAMPTTHWKPTALIDGQKGCGACHKIGVKTEEEIAALKADGQMFGNAACDSCHTRHTFSLKEASEPEACRTCHMGFDHPQWEMYSSSKHGVRYQMKRDGILSDSTSAPTCQICHLPDGTHENRTAWGFLAVRLPMPEGDAQWTADRAVILTALNVLDSSGNPTGRLDVVKAADVARLTQEDFDRERNKMISVCSECHSDNFARDEMAKGDDMIREADHLMAEAIRVVAALYADGILEKPETYGDVYPDLLTFHDAPTTIEQTLFVMFLKHRMRTFQGTFHANPDYALWYGWNEMVMDLTEIKEKAAEMRKD